MDQLFLLRPGFIDLKHAAKSPSYFCSHCAMIDGYLNYYPSIKDQLQIILVDFVRPRPQIIELIGEENQSCPVLVLNNAETINGNFAIQKYGETRFINDANEITAYLASKFGSSFPH